MTYRELALFFINRGVRGDRRGDAHSGCLSFPYLSEYSFLCDPGVLGGKTEIGFVFSIAFRATESAEDTEQMDSRLRGNDKQEY